MPILIISLCNSQMALLKPLRLIIYSMRNLVLWVQCGVHEDSISHQKTCITILLKYPVKWYINRKSVRYYLALSTPHFVLTATHGTLHHCWRANRWITTWARVISILAMSHAICNSVAPFSQLAPFNLCLSCKSWPREEFEIRFNSKFD